MAAGRSDGHAAVGIFTRDRAGLNRPCQEPCSGADLLRFAKFNWTGGWEIAQGCEIKKESAKLFLCGFNATGGIKFAQGDGEHVLREVAKH